MKGRWLLVGLVVALFALEEYEAVVRDTYVDERLMRLTL